MIAWKYKGKWYAGTVRFLLGIASPALCAWPYDAEPWDSLNGRKIKMVIKIGRQYGKR
jgi:hypothetical protein